MKKIFLLITLASSILACKKESSNPTNNSTTNSNNTNPVNCIDNPNINFTCIGTPIGKFGDCIKDVDGNTYKTVTIGTQTWMAENLKTSKYNDGTDIPNVTDAKQWTELTTGAWCNYNNSDSLGKIYGKLYNWYATNPTTNGNKNVCPSGWHVPSIKEWTTIIDYLGGENIAGGKMKEIDTSSWKNPNNYATNVSLFTGLPSGQLTYNSGESYFFHHFGMMWSNTEKNTTDAWGYNLYYKVSSIDRDEGDKKYGLSIRCLKD